MLNSTPRWAKIVSYKYASLGADSVVDDLRECNGRTLSNRYCKMLGDAVRTFATAKEESWEYGKEQFHARFVRELERVKAKFPKIVRDGAADNWSFLPPLTDHQLVDFYHANRYRPRFFRRRCRSPSVFQGIVAPGPIHTEDHPGKPG